MIRIRTQSPIAVSMVAGRVCKCGVGSRLLCMSVMGTLPGNRNENVIKRSTKARNMEWARPLIHIREQPGGFKKNSAMPVH